jgi:hypothetical protein
VNISGIAPPNVPHVERRERCRRGNSRPNGKSSQLEQSALYACCIQSKPLLLLNSQLRQLRAALLAARCHLLSAMFLRMRSDSVTTSLRSRAFSSSSDTTSPVCSSLVYSSHPGDDPSTPSCVLCDGYPVPMADPPIQVAERAPLPSYLEQE